MERNSPAGAVSSPGASALGTSRPFRSASRIWRILATGLGFVQVGILSLLLALFIFPIIRLLPGTREEKEIRSQRWIHRGVRIHFRTLEVLQVMRLRCVGAEHLLRPGVLIVANHPTMLDAFCLMSLMPQADCVMKASHSDNPFLAGAAKGAGYIPNVDGPRLVDDCVARLARGRSVIVFPEGTRSPANSLGPFFRGAAHVALKAGCDPVPVTIECEPAALYRGRAWWDVPERKFTLTLTVGEPLIVKDILERATPIAVTPSALTPLPVTPIPVTPLPLTPLPVPRAARILTAALRNHFERHLIVV